MPIHILQPSLRDARRSDLPRIVEIYNSTVPSRMVTADTEPVTVEQREPWFEKHVPGYRPLWVAEVDGEVVGWVSFESFYGRPAYSATAELSIYVAESHRRQGIGRYLLNQAVHEAPTFGVKTLLGFIFSHNLPSLALFESFGFEVWGQYPNIAVLDGIERSLSVVGKRIVE